MPPASRRLVVLLPCLAAIAGCIRVNASVGRGEDAPWAAPGPEYTRGDTAERFAPGVVSTGTEFASAFTRDGRTVFFTRTNQDRSRLTLMRSRLVNGTWSAPEPVLLGPITRAMDPHVAPDGKRLFFTAPRRQEAGAITEPGGDWDTYVAELADDGSTGAYRRLEGPFNTERVEMYTSVTRSGALYYGTAPLPGSADTTWRGVWRADLASGGATRRLEGPVNMPGFEGGNPYVTPDERVLIFGSARPGGSGRGDLWMSVRAADGRWGEPVNLGPAVNGPEVEFCPQLSPDGRFLFFSRVHYRGEERVGNDVYVIRVSSVPALAAALRR